MNLIKYISKLTFTDCIDTLKLFIAIFLLPFYKRKYRGAWLICERRDSAQDNGWIFYQWLKKNKANEKVYFVINGDYIKNNNIIDANIIKWGSIKHFKIYLSINIFIKTIFLTPFPSGRVCDYFNKLSKKRIEMVYLKHGIIKDGVEHHHYSVQKIRLFICGAKPEYDYIKVNAGYPDGYVKYTGLARFDDLIDKQSNEKFILIIPTWRRYICDDFKSKKENETLFLNSEYYKHYQSLLSNEELVDYATKKGYRIKFCIHNEFRNYLHLFHVVDKRIEIVKPNESIHNLLMTTSLLITDYSSVFFDIAYMKKPMIFYQFDYDEYRRKHFSVGYFNYVRDGMGPVVESEKELVETLKSFYNGYFLENKEKYIKRCDTFFPIHDNNNCQRIYEAIKAIE